MYVITKSDFGGAQKYVLDLATFMKERGNDVSVAHGARNFTQANVFIQSLSEKGIRTIPLQQLNRDVRLFADIKVFFELVRLFRKERPNIIHLNSSKIGALGAIAGRIAGCERIVYTAHGLPHLEPRPFWQRQIIKVLTWLTFVFVHKVIVVSESELAQVRQWWWVKKKVTKIYNGIGDIDFLPKDRAREELGTRIGSTIANTLIIGSIAELTPNKGLLEFLPALKALKEAGGEFIYLHFGAGELEEQLRAETENLGLSEQVYWLGFDAYANRYLKAFDIFTLPSLKEGLPYVLLEAGLAELPVVATNVGGISEILCENRGVVVPVNNKEILTDQLETLVNSREKRKELGNNLGQYMASTLTTSTMFQKTKELYNLNVWQYLK